jgi:hypothetical protein
MGRDLSDGLEDENRSSDAGRLRAREYKRKWRARHLGRERKRARSESQRSRWWPWSAKKVTLASLPASANENYIRFQGEGLSADRD